MENVHERGNFGKVITTTKIKASGRCFESTSVTKILEIAMIARWVNYIGWLHEEIKSHVS